MIVVDRDDLVDGLELFDQVGSLGAFDAVLAAAARRREADALVSADVAFSTVADCTTPTRHHPGSPPRSRASADVSGADPFDDQSVAASRSRP